MERVAIVLLEMDRRLAKTGMIALVAAILVYLGLTLKPVSRAMWLIRMGTAILHTSPGLGTSKYAPFRFACRPEATLLELRTGRRDPGSVRLTSERVDRGIDR